MKVSPSLLNPPTPKFCSLLSSPTATSAPLSCPYNLYRPKNFILNPRISRRASILSLPPRSLQFSRQNGVVDEDDDEPVIGDCLVFEEGIFDDPFLQEESLIKPRSNQPKRKLKQKSSIEVVEPENLIPEKWIEVQKEINITKKERRKLAQELEFGRKVEKRREALNPIGGSGNVKNVRLDEYLKYRDEKLNQLKPLVLDNPEFSEDEQEQQEDDDKEVQGNAEEDSNVNASSSRVPPRNPRLAVYGGGLDDITEFFNSGIYDPKAAKTSSEGIPFGSCFHFLYGDFL